MLPYGVQPVDEDGEVIHADSDGSVVQNFDWEMEQKVWSSGADWLPTQIRTCRLI